MVPLRIAGSCSHPVDQQSQSNKAPRVWQTRARAPFEGKLRKLQGNINQSGTQTGSMPDLPEVA